jgi:hypothetical protein
MAFSRTQQPEYRRLVDAAWAAAGLPSSQRRAWYEEQLLSCVGVSSTIPLDKARDYDVACAWFEALADNGDYKWQARAETGDHARILSAALNHRDPKNPPHLQGAPLTPEYCSAIAQQSLRLPAPPPLRTLSKQQLQTVIRAIAIQHRRSLNAAN